MSTFGLILAVVLVIIGLLAIHAVTHAIWLLFVGLIVGALGRMALRGSRDVGLFGTALLGAGGSFAGGVITKSLHVHSWLVQVGVSILCAAVLIAIFTDRAD